MPHLKVTELLGVAQLFTTNFTAGFNPAFFMSDKPNNIIISQPPVILFDGICNLCSSAVKFVIKRDKKSRYKFASLQSAFGAALLNEYHLSTNALNSFILYENSRIYTKSTGALMVCRQLSGAWPLLYLFIIIPSSIRDSIYNFIAKHRYKWFGKKETCWIPSLELKNRFLN